MRGGIVFALVFVLALNAFFFWGQTAVADINPSGSTQFFSYTGSHIQSYDQGSYTLPTNPSAELPPTSSSISPTTGNIFTDAWNAITNWLLGATGAKYLIAIVNTVPNVLQSIGLPAAFSFAIGYLWYAFSLLIVIMFIRGIVQ